MTRRFSHLCWYTERSITSYSMYIIQPWGDNLYVCFRNNHSMSTSQLNTLDFSHSGVQLSPSVVSSLRWSQLQSVTFLMWELTWAEFIAACIRPAWISMPTRGQLRPNLLLVQTGWVVDRALWVLCYHGYMWLALLWMTIVEISFKLETMFVVLPSCSTRENAK